MRDKALVRLLHDVALRREEACALDVEDLDLEAGTVAILGKGRASKEKLTLPEPTKDALRAWLHVRGSEPGPLFHNFDRAAKGRRLTGRSVHRMIGRLGKDVGLTVRPHGLRHSAITEALEVTQGNIRAVARFSRHKQMAVIAVYDDCRRDLGGEVARLVAAGTDVRSEEPLAEAASSSK